MLCAALFFVSAAAALALNPLYREQRSGNRDHLNKGLKPCVTA